MAEKLKIIPLGGLNEIGKNMTAYEYGGEIIVVDCGMAFPGGRHVRHRLRHPRRDLSHQEPEPASGACSSPTATRTTSAPSPTSCKQINMPHLLHPLDRRSDQAEAGGAPAGDKSTKLITVRGRQDASGPASSPWSSST